MSAEQELANANVQISTLISEVTRWRDASAGLNSIYPTITEGRQSVGDGKYFSVPGNGAYMRLYRRQGSSAELIAEFPDVATLNSVIDQLGPLLGRGVVGGGGDLMAEGAFGLGANGSVMQDNLAWSELFSGNDTINSIFNANNVDGSEIGYSGNAAGGWVVNRGARPVAFFFGNSNELRSTRWTGANWEPHIRYVTNNMIIGTVSQEGGIPTGAIIERGSNASGEYVKLADGTLICSIRKRLPDNGAFTSDGSVFSSTPVEVAFPHAFVGIPSVTQGMAKGVAGGWVGLGNSATTSLGTSIRGFRASYVSSSSAEVSIIAIGSWY